MDDLRATLQARGDAPPADAVPSPTIYRPFFSETADAFHTTGQDEPHSMLGGAPPSPHRKQHCPTSRAHVVPAEI